jgi:hypothetical protein
MSTPGLYTLSTISSNAKRRCYGTRAPGKPCRGSQPQAHADGGRPELERNLVGAGVQLHGPEVEVCLLDGGGLSIHFNRPPRVEGVRQDKITGRAKRCPQFNALRLVADQVDGGWPAFAGKWLTGFQDDLSGGIEARISQSGKRCFVIRDHTGVVDDKGAWLHRKVFVDLDVA